MLAVVCYSSWLIIVKQKADKSFFFEVEFNEYKNKEMVLCYEIFLMRILTLIFLCDYLQLVTAPNFPRQ